MNATMPAQYATATRSPHARGFTLIEVLVVLAIIGVFVAVGSGAYVTSLPAKRLNGATRDLQLNLVRARALAIRENSPYFVCFDTSAHSYEIDQVDTTVSPLPTACGDTGTTTVDTLVLDDDHRGVRFGFGSLSGTRCEPTMTGGFTDPVTFASDQLIFNSKGSVVQGLSAVSPVVAVGGVYLYNPDDTDTTGCVYILGAVGLPKATKWDGTAWQ